MLISPSQGAIPEPSKPWAHAGVRSHGAEVGGLREMLCVLSPASAAHGQRGWVPSGNKKCLLLGVLCSGIVVACVAFSSLTFV